MQLLEKKDVRIIDTTCPWVSKVWNAVDSHRKKDMTTVLHGKFKHEEAIATASMAEDYIMVLNLEEANYVINYILNGGDKAEFMEKFKYATSEGFDPDTMLARIGIANQTTMYKEETAAIAKMFERCMLKKVGPEKVNEHFMALGLLSLVSLLSSLYTFLDSSYRHIYVGIYTCVFERTHVYYICINVQTCSDMYVHIYIHTNTNIYIYICTYMHHIHMCVYKYVYAWVYVCEWLCVCVHAHTITHAHNLSLSLSLSLLSLSLSLSRARALSFSLSLSLSRL